MSCVASKLTWRYSTTGNVVAAYCGEVRVGYVTHSPSRRINSTLPPYIYNSNFLQPSGGCYVGRMENEESAKAALSLAFDHWLRAANLRTR